MFFVHGFAGHPGRTWRKIQDFLTDTWWDESDLFFFGYPSVRESIATTATRLGHLVRRLVQEPPDDLFADANLRRSGTTYEDIVLVGHSQGGLVVRQAVLDMLWDVLQGRPADPVESSVAAANVRLFAPAIWGVQVAGLKGIVLKSFGPGTLIRILLGGSPSYAEMKEPRSDLLRNLKEFTEAFSQRNQHISALKASIAWAEKELVVASGSPYFCDPAAIMLTGTDHQSVCKANTSNGDVMTFVEHGR